MTRSTRRTRTAMRGLTPDDFLKKGDEAEAQIPSGVSRGLADAIWARHMFGQAALDDIAEFFSSGDELSQADRELHSAYIKGKLKLPPRKPPLAHLVQSRKTTSIEAAHNEVRRLILEWTAAGQKCCPPGMEYEKFREQLDHFVRRSKRQKRRLKIGGVVIQGDRPWSRLWYRKAYLNGKADLPNREADAEADQLWEVVERIHGGTVMLAHYVRVRETFEGQAVWEGIVHVFALARPTGLAFAETRRIWQREEAAGIRVYAWSSPIEGSTERRFFTAPHTARINSPSEAVRAAIAAGAHRPREVVGLAST